jgi:hypothetical protein
MAHSGGVVSLTNLLLLTQCSCKGLVIFVVMMMMPMIIISYLFLF